MTKNKRNPATIMRMPGHSAVPVTGGGSVEAGAAAAHTVRSSSIDRRALLKFMGATVALSGAACEPREQILPYVNMPEQLVPGEANSFASILPLLGYGSPVVATSHQGRPTKLDGNPDHPWSRGASDAFTQAAVLTLYDPDRARAPVRANEIKTWNDVLSELVSLRDRARANGGASLRVLSNAVTSPTLIRQMALFRERFPKAVWHQWQPVNSDAARAGAKRAFGRVLDTIYHFERCRIVLVLDGDPLGPGPNQVRYGRDFSDVRRARSGTDWLARLYVAEPGLSLTGVQADVRIAMRSSGIGALAGLIAARLAGEEPDSKINPQAAEFAEAAADDLKRHRGAAAVVTGERQPPVVHALVHWMNGQLDAPGKTVSLIEPPSADTVSHSESIRALAADMHAGKVETLLVLGGNPAYDSPAGLGLAEAFARIPFTIRLGLYEDETSKHCLWHLPESHPLECWSDLQTPDGTAAIAQPLITPLFDTRSVHEVIGMLLGEMEPSGKRIVQETWKTGREGDFGPWWFDVLRKGVIAGSARTPVTAAPAPSRPAVEPPEAGKAFELAFEPDPAVWDGRFANNAWLQETPRPLSKRVWTNVLKMAQADAVRLGIGTGDMVRLSADSRTIEVPAFIAAGQAEGAISLSLGYGRERAGTIGTGLGANAFALRTLDRPWIVPGVRVERTGRTRELPATQHHFSEEGRDIVRTLDLRDLASLSPAPVPPMLYPEYVYDTYAWAMVIDQSVCIGCNACVVACQAENNVPVVGPGQIRLGRDMHWLRIDLYLNEEAGSPQPSFQPVACMHCEAAPCEPVCPVEASVHDGEGLNVQVYNRCVGTRFCQSNCPYKVRRFNFFGYANEQRYANLGDDLYNAVSNPDVTVRARGVMEKCTYCIQRISYARRQARKENRRIREGEIVTACQAACPTQAIFFGDQNREQGRIARLQREPHAYDLLGHLGTRPRTTYLAKVRESGGGKSGA